MNHNITDNARSIENPDFLFENPSGLLYCYSESDKSIYILENVKKGIFIYKLAKLLKAMK